MEPELIEAAELGAGDFIIHEGAEWHVSNVRRYKVGTEAREYVLTSSNPKVAEPVTIMLAASEPVTRTFRWGQKVSATMPRQRRGSSR